MTGTQPKSQSYMPLINDHMNPCVTSNGWIRCIGHYCLVSEHDVNEALRLMRMSKVTLTLFHSNIKAHVKCFQQIFESFNQINELLCVEYVYAGVPREQQ